MSRRDKPMPALSQASLSARLRRQAEVQFRHAADLTREAADKIELYEGFLAGLLKGVLNGQKLTPEQAKKALDHLALHHL
jgi:hypothetical protein